MSNGNWRTFAKKGGYQVDGNAIIVGLANSRTQKVAVEEQRDGSSVRLWSAIASKSRVEEPGICSPHRVRMGTEPTERPWWDFRWMGEGD